MIVHLGVTGSRNFTNYYTFKTCVDAWKKEHDGIINKIIVGNCRGTDRMAQRYATENNIELVIHVADWNKYGRSAGPRRNSLIVRDCTHMIGFPQEASVGTWDTIRKAKAANINTTIIDV